MARDQQGTVPADVKAAHDGGEDAGAAERFRRPVRRERGEQRENDLDARVPRPAPQPQAQISDEQPPRDLADHDGDEHQCRIAEREGAERHRGDGEAVEDQRGGVVGEAFALDHHHGPPRHAEPPRDRHRCHLVGRRDDGAEHEADRPVPVEQEMHDGGDRDRREGHAAEREQADRADVVAELAPAHGDTGGIDQRRHHEQEHELRRKLDPRQSRHQRDQKPDHHEEDGDRDAGAVRRDGDDRDRHQDEDQDGIGLHGLTERG